MEHCIPLITKVTMGFRAKRDEEDWFSWVKEMVDYHMEQQGQNPDVQTPIEFQYYVARHGIKSNYQERTHEKLVQDVNVLHKFMGQMVTEKNWMRDRITKLSEEKDQLRNSWLTATSDVKWANLKIWILTAVVTGEGCVIGWVAHELLLRFH